MKFSIKHNTFILGHEKEMYWPEKKTIIISDLHLGKIKHFSENGVQVPALANQNNYWRLAELLEKYECKRVLLLGDLFHSVYNAEWEKFIDFINNYEDIHWTLVKGNHDILGNSEWKRAGLEVYTILEEEGILFTHEPFEETTPLYNLCGHIHPAVRLKGNANLNIKLPCFYFGNSKGILPAFGEFTGTHVIKPKKGDKIFVIGNEEVFSLS